MTGFKVHIWLPGDNYNHGKVVTLSQKAHHLKVAVPVLNKKFDANVNPYDVAMQTKSLEVKQFRYVNRIYFIAGSDIQPHEYEVAAQVFGWEPYRCPDCQRVLEHMLTQYKYQCPLCGWSISQEIVELAYDDYVIPKSTVYEDILTMQAKLNMASPIKPLVKDDYKDKPATAVEFEVEPLDGPEFFKFL